MIEREKVACAIYGENPETHNPASCLTCLGYADAAIKAVLDGLMEPSEEMVEAMYGPYLSPTSHEIRIKAFRAMIAAERARLFGEDGK